MPAFTSFHFYLNLFDLLISLAFITCIARHFSDNFDYKVYHLSNLNGVVSSFLVPFKDTAVPWWGHEKAHFCSVLWNRQQSSFLELTIKDMDQDTGLGGVCWDAVVSAGLVLKSIFCQFLRINVTTSVSMRRWQPNNWWGSQAFYLLKAPSDMDQCRKIL